jgi:hypothetical protein
MLTMMFRGELLIVKIGKYQSNGRMAVELTSEDGAPFAHLSCNLPNEPLGQGEFFMKDYAENASLAEAAKKSGLFTPVGRTAQTGYVTVSVWRFANAATDPSRQFDVRGTESGRWKAESGLGTSVPKNAGIPTREIDSQRDPFID